MTTRNPYLFPGVRTAATSTRLNSFAEGAYGWVNPAATAYSAAATADISGATLTIAVGTAGRILAVFASAQVAVSGANYPDWSMTALLDGVSLGLVGNDNATQMIGNHFTSGMVWAVDPSVGNHTIKLQLTKTATSTLTINPMLIVIGMGAST